jgi:hypothetical protein
MFYAGTFFGSILLLFLLSKMVTMKLSHLFYRVTKNKTITINLMAILFFPGTVIHELSHFLMAALLFVPVGHIDLWPKMEEENTVKLGSVHIGQTDIFRRFLIGAAPFLFGIALLLAVLFFGVSSNLFGEIWFIVIMMYVAFEVGNTMFSSKKDMEGALELFGVILFFVIVFYFLGVRIPSFDPKVFFDHPTVTQVFKQGSLFLLVPLGIDIAMLLLLRLFSFKKLQ